MAFSFPPPPSPPAQSPTPRQSYNVMWGHGPGRPPPLDRQGGREALTDGASGGGRLGLLFRSLSSGKGAGFAKRAGAQGVDATRDRVGAGKAKDQRDDGAGVLRDQPLAPTEPDELSREVRGMVWS